MCLKTRRGHPNATQQSLRTHLGRFGLSGERATRAVRTLSGGQRTRLALASCTYVAPHVLVLDEPTNHLSLQSQDALIKGLAEFEGGLIFISHDQHFIEALSDELWVIENRTVVRLDSFAKYKSQHSR